MANLPEPTGTAAVDNGAIYYDGSAAVQGHEESFNQSRTWADATPQDGWTPSIPGSCTITEDGTELTMTGDGIARSWAGANAVSFKRTITPVPGALLAYTHVTTPNNIGNACGFAVTLGADDQNFGVYNNKDTPQYNLYAYEADAVTAVIQPSQQAIWMGVLFDGGTVRFIYSTNAVGSEPTDDEWTFFNRTYTPAATWNRIDMELIMWGSDNAGDSESYLFRKVHVRYL